MGQVVILNDLSISDHFVGQYRREIFCQTIVTPSESAPLLPLVFEAINIDCDWSAGEPEDGCERRVCGITNQRGVVASRNGMDGGNKSVDHSVEIFVAYRGKYFQSNAVIFQLPRRDVVSATINCNLMTTCHQASRKVFCKSFEASIARWNASSSQNSDAHNLQLVGELCD